MALTHWFIVFSQFPNEQAGRRMAFPHNPSFRLIRDALDGHDLATARFSYSSNHGQVSMEEEEEADKNIPMKPVFEMPVVKLLVPAVDAEINMQLNACKMQARSFSHEIASSTSRPASTTTSSIQLIRQMSEISRWRRIRCVQPSPYQPTPYKYESQAFR